MKKLSNTIITPLLAVILAVSLAACSSNSNNGNKPAGEKDGAVGEIPQVTVNFAMEPYPDHTDSIVAIEKDWYKEVGITVKTSVVDADKVASVLVAGTADVASAAPVLMMPSMKQEQFQTFVFGNLFHGYAIMAQPDAGYKTFADFTKEGMSAEEAIKATVEQMKGKVFTYPSEAAIKPFIDLFFKKADMSLEDVTSDVQQDSNGVSLMLAKRADFKVGGVPSRLTLEAAGMVPILSSADIVTAALPSSHSIEIRSILHNGWTATKKWHDANHDTVLRLASVRFRLNQFYNDQAEEAAAIHIPYLNKQAGTNFTKEEGLVLYKSQIPMYTLEQQESWFENESDPLFWRYEIESNMKMYEEQGIFEKDQYKAEDLVSAESIYKELKDLRSKTEANMAKLEGASGKALELKELAQKHYDIFNFLDAHRFSSQAIEAMQ